MPPTSSPQSMKGNSPLLPHLAVGHHGHFDKLAKDRRTGRNAEAVYCTIGGVTTDGAGRCKSVNRNFLACDTGLGHDTVTNTLRNRTFWPHRPLSVTRLSG